MKKRNFQLKIGGLFLCLQEHQKKQFSEQQKLQIINYYKNHSLKETISKFDVSSASIYRWKNQLLNNKYF